MNYTVQVSDEAERDLIEFYQYIAHTLGAPETASKLLRRLEQAFHGLEQLPERFRRYEKEPWRSRGLRFFPVGNHLVFYTVRTDSSIVVINRILYGGRDIDRVLGD